MQVLLDNGSDEDLVFVSNDKPMLLPYFERLVPQSWNTLNGIFKTKVKLGQSRTSLTILIAKGNM